VARAAWHGAKLSLIKGQRQAGEAEMADNGDKGKNGHGGPILLLLFIPLLVLYVPFYNRLEPALFGFPFFYWFQLGWIFVSMIITAVVYYGTEPR
jgi:hypothetical protein